MITFLAAINFLGGHMDKQTNNADIQNTLWPYGAKDT